MRYHYLVSDTEQESAFEEYEAWRHENNTRGWLMVAAASNPNDDLEDRASAWRQDGYETKITRNPITRRLCLFTRLPREASP